jgi:predicted nuclease with TOPRIM domain
MPPRSPVTPLLVIVAASLLPARMFRGKGRSFSGHTRELMHYRSVLTDYTGRIDTTLAELGELTDALRRRDVDIDEAVDRLASGEDELDVIAEDMRDMEAPEQLHSLHLEYEANLERALRGIVTAERGCGLTRQRHRPPDDEEPLAYWKRGHANIVHARMRMQEVAEVLLAWEPGRVAEVSVHTRLQRDA